VSLPWLGGNTAAGNLVGVAGAMPLSSPAIGGAHAVTTSATAQPRNPALTA
jgi:hypothetical protein